MLFLLKITKNELKQQLINIVRSTKSIKLIIKKSHYDH
jgi:hypothetical protein